MLEYSDAVPKRQLVVVAVDFGTTYSSIAYAQAESRDLYSAGSVVFHPSDVHFVQSYMAKGKLASLAAVPTILAYESGTGHSYFGVEIQEAKSQQILRAEDQVELIKLLLGRKEDTEERFKALRARISNIRRRDVKTGRRSKKCPTIPELISDCLRNLWANLEYTLHGRYGDACKIWDIECVLCVPAVWTEVENQQMIDAAELAGLPKSYLVSEAEAAAVLYFATEGDITEVSLSYPDKYGHLFLPFS